MARVSTRSPFFKNRTTQKSISSHERVCAELAVWDGSQGETLLRITCCIILLNCNSSLLKSLERVSKVIELKKCAKLLLYVVLERAGRSKHLTINFHNECTNKLGTSKAEYFK